MVVPSPAVATAGEDSNTRSAFELADVVRAYGASFLSTHATSGQQRRVLRAIARCRTAALGGHVEGCDECGFKRISYNSCRNRHCPKCQGKERAQWMAAEQALLLPVPYFHVVFTLPHALNALVRINRRLLYALLFRTAAATLATFARDPRHLGAEPAVTMVLHSWGQTLQEHYHVHCIVSGGGLSYDGRSWVAAPSIRRGRRPFLFPVKALSKVFRGKLIAALERARRRGKLRHFPHGAAPAPWDDLIAKLRGHPWVVYSKPPFGGPEQVLKYLSRYTHRVAISNRRIRFVGDGVVRFCYRDYADHSRTKEMTLPATELLRRFLHHIVPKGFMRIRHYGITANCRRRHKLTRCRELLERLSPTSTPAPNPLRHDSADPTPDPCDPPAARCSLCGSAMRLIEVLAPTTTPYDTS